MEIKNILVIRFRRVGDSILALALLRTLKKSFPEAKIDYVLDEGLASLYEDHPDIDNLILYSHQEKHSLPKYLAKTWRVMHAKHYDAIIDMRSTVQTLWFSLFSLGTPFRIGRMKKYNSFIHNYRLFIPRHLDMVKQDVALAAPLSRAKPLTVSHEFRIYPGERRNQFRKIMEEGGIDFNKPVVVAAIATRIQGKEWNKERMKQTIKLIIDTYGAQVIFNFGGKTEEEYAEAMRQEMGCDPHIFTNIKAGSLKDLAAMIANCDFFFGNEGGPRHLAHALGIPSFAIYPPNINKRTWLPENDGTHQGVSSDDVWALSVDREYSERFALITVDEVWSRLKPMLDKYLKR